MAKITVKSNGWHVLGAGAMGCLWAARLWQASQLTGAPDVTLLLRDEQALSAYLNAGGIVLDTGTGKIFCPVAATTVDGISYPISTLLIATKAQHALPALQSVSHALSPQSRIVLLQNGIQSQRQICTQVGAQRVYCLSTSHGAWLRSPFQVVHAGFGDAWLGQFTHPCADIQTMLDLLPVQQMNIHHDPDINHRLWHKFAINCAVNALTVIHNCPNGDLLTLPDARLQLIELCAEIEQIFAAVPDAPALKNLLSAVEEVLRVTASNYSSTLQDIRNGKPTEIADLNGCLVELAQHHQCPAPLNMALTQAVLLRQTNQLREDNARNNEKPA
jgi:2-dehydropantoate 2-reductase